MASMSAEALQAKYEGVLNELKMAREQGERSEQNVSRLNIEVADWRSRLQLAEKERTVLVTQHEHQIEERVRFEVGKARAEGEERVVRLQSEVGMLRESLNGKNQEIQTLMIQKDQMTK